MFFGWGTKDARPKSIPREDLERALGEFCKPPAPDSKTGSRQRISTDNFHHIAGLLRHLESHEGLKGWSLRPRTYTVLRNINRLDAMQAIIDLGLKDISLPYSRDALSEILPDRKAQTDFLNFQQCVLTRASDLEKGPEGDHVHFAKDEGDKHFHWVKHLGSGGFGSVDHVWSRLSFKHYARKQFRRGRNAADHKQVLHRFEEELSALKRLSHYHLVRVVGSYTEQKRVAFLMEPVADCNLMAYLSQPTSKFYNLLPSLRTYFGCLANAVAYLHRQKIRHRDLKPENILLSKGRLYVADFGAALDWSRRGHSTTFSDAIPHTARYMAPEVAKDAPRNSASDMWSLGIVFLEMSTVLRGKTIKEMRKFMEKNGSGHPFVWGNMGAAHEWFEVLRQNKSGQDSDNEPLSWIKDMIQRDPLTRPRAKALVGHIMESTSPGSFCGICCRDDDDSTASSFSSPSTSLSEGSYDTARQELNPFELFGHSTEVFVRAPRQDSRSVERWLETTNQLAIDLLPATSLESPDAVPGLQHDISEESPAATTVVLTHRRSDGTPRLTELDLEDENPGYDVIEDDSDDDEIKQEDQGYEVVEDSSGSEVTVRPTCNEPKFLGEDFEQHNPWAESEQTPGEKDSEQQNLVVLRSQSPRVHFDDDESSMVRSDMASINSDPILLQLESTADDVDDSSETSLVKVGRLTARNLAKHSVDTSNIPSVAHGPSKPIPDFSAKFYMQEVWEEASSAPTSALSENTRQKLNVSNLLLRYQDKSMNYLEQFTQRGNARATLILLRAKCNPGTEEKPRPQPLINAVMGGSPRHTKCARYLLEHGANVNVQYRSTGKTALHLAIEHRDFHGHSNLIWLLLEAGANPNVKDRNGDYPLLKILYGDYDPLEKYKRDALALLLQPQISTDVNIMPPGTLNMPIHLAVRRKDPWAVGMLLEAGAEANRRNGAGLTPLLLAANGWNVSAGHEEEQKQVLQQLLYHGADVKERGGDGENTALHQAVLNGRKDAVELIMAYGGDPRIKNKEQKTACHLGAANAAKCSAEVHSSIMSRLFQEIGLDIPSEKDQCAITTAVLNDDLSSAKTLLEYGANANHRSKQTNSCPRRPILHHAITSGNQDMVELLVRHGASIAAKDDESGINAVDYARETGQSAIADYLAGELK